MIRFGLIFPYGLFILLGSNLTCLETEESAPKQCRFWLIVNEMDTRRCPNMVSESSQERLSSASEGIHADETSPGDRLNFTSTDYNTTFTKSTNSGNYVHKLQEIENRVLLETVKNRDLQADFSEHKRQFNALNDTVHRHLNSANNTDDELARIDEKYEDQRIKVESIERKLTELLLDMTELHHRLESEAQRRSEVEEKVVDVQSLSAISACSASIEETAYKDCEQVFLRGNTKSGIYFVKSIYSACPIAVYCDMETPPGGWLVIQRRKNGVTSFTEGWKRYRKGFGDLSGDFWLGNENIFLLTNQKGYKLRIDMWDFYGSRVFAEYRHFKIDGERDLFRLHVSNHSGTAPDALMTHNGKYFSTPDRDNDSFGEYHCARQWKAGWWFSNCWFAFLNGQYYNTSGVRYKGIAWNSWKREQLKKVEMKISPSGF